MAGAASQGGVNRRNRQSEHEGFLRHKQFRWLKIALIFTFALSLGYVFADVGPRPGGGTWYGYILGTIGALLILWLSLLGLRKRAITPGQWTLKGWTSAHVYLGLSLIVVATLHTGFQFGWNVHTLAYVLMMLVIGSGIWGIIAYATLPITLSQNRASMTQRNMIDSLRAVDRQLHSVAQPLSPDWAMMVQDAIAQDPMKGSIFARVTGRYRDCMTTLAVEQFNRNSKDADMERVETLLIKRKGQLDRIRQHLRTKALLEVWLYLHIPLTFTLIVALAAHVISVFYYW